MRVICPLVAHSTLVVNTPWRYAWVRRHRLHFRPESPSLPDAGSMRRAMMDKLIEVRDLVKHYPMKGGLFRGRTIGLVKAVDGVSFSINQGESFALVAGLG